MHMPDGTETGLQVWLYKSFYVPHFSPINASLAWAITQITFWFLILWIMYKKKIIIKV